MLERVLALAAVLLALAWLAASAFVAFYEPAGLPDTTLVLTVPEGERPRYELAHPPPTQEQPEGVAFLPLYGEVARGSVASSADGVLDSGQEYLLARGALDAARGTFPPAVGLVGNAMSMMRPRRRIDRLLEDLSAYAALRWLASED